MTSVNLDARTYYSEQVIVVKEENRVITLAILNTSYILSGSVCRNVECSTYIIKYVTKLHSKAKMNIYLYLFYFYY